MTLFLTSTPEALEEDKSVWINQWEKIGSLPSEKSDFGVAINDGYVYVIGGTDNYNFLDKVIMAKVSEDGTIGSWTEQPPLNIKRSFFGTLFHKGYLYVVGGESGSTDDDLLNSVERAKVGKDGSLGKWIVEKSRTNFNARCIKLVKYNNFIYSLGGWMGMIMNTVERAQINKDGSLGEWIVEDELMLVNRYIHSVFIEENRIFVLAGHDVKAGMGISNVEYSDIKPDGSLTNWKKSRSLPFKTFGQSLLKIDKSIYLVGGRDGDSHTLSDSVRFGFISNDLTGVIKWKKTAKLELPLEHVGTFHYKKWIYLLGGANKKGAKKRIYRAEIDRDMSLGSYLSKKEYDAVQIYYDGVEKFQKGDYGGAKRDFMKAIKMNENYLDAYYNMGLAYIFSGDFNSAIDLMKGVTKKNPDFGDAYLIVAIGYDRKGDIINSLKYVELAIDNGFGDLALFRNNEIFNNLRKSKEFSKLLERKFKDRFLF